MRSRQERFIRVSWWHGTLLITMAQPEAHAPWMGVPNGSRPMGSTWSERLKCCLQTAERSHSFLRRMRHHGSNGGLI